MVTDTRMSNLLTDIQIWAMLIPKNLCLVKKCINLYCTKYFERQVVVCMEKSI